MNVDASLPQALARLPKGAGLPLMGAALAIYAAFLVSFKAFIAVFGVAPGTRLLYGGLNPAQLCYTAFEQFFAVGWSAGLLILFRERVNFAPGQWGAVVIGSAYTVYIIHTVVVFSLTRALSGLWPIHRLLQFAVETPIALVVSWLAAIAIKALPYAGRVL